MKNVSSVNIVEYLIITCRIVQTTDNDISTFFFLFFFFLVVVVSAIQSNKTYLYSQVEDITFTEKCPLGGSGGSVQAGKDRGEKNYINYVVIYVSK